MDPTAGWNKLNYALRTLQEKWDQTEAGWRDRKRAEFEKDSLLPIRDAVESSQRAMKELAVILARAHRECREEAE